MIITRDARNGKGMVGSMNLLYKKTKRPLYARLEDSQNTNSFPRRDQFSCLALEASDFAYRALVLASAAEHRATLPRNRREEKEDIPFFSSLDSSVSNFNHVQ